MVLYIVITLVSAAGVCRSVRLGVRADAQGVLHRGLERSKPVPWCQVRMVTKGTAGGGSPIPTGTATLVLYDGEDVVLTGMVTCAFTRRSVVRLARRTARLRALHRSHHATCPTCRNR
ncbi:MULTISPECIES: hypothetical protein [unclassified Kitasatospora]|uniref:hypothetical protein n=1 Tax=unclassified Kitasatospora TaxID=2633591 RepID=UPI0038166793